MPARKNPLPLYAQVMRALQEEIECEMKPGDALVSEPELERRFKVSRITVRRALDELVSLGLIVRQQGRGTFVREQPIAHELSLLLSWSAQMRRIGYEPKSSDCMVQAVEPAKEHAAMLELAPGERVVRIYRLRYANDEPICIMINSVPEVLVPGLVERGLVNDSFYETIFGYGVRPASTEDKVVARLANQREARLLGISRRSPLLEITRLARDANNKPIYLATVTNRADKYVYMIRLEA